MMRCRDFTFSVAIFQPIDFNAFRAKETTIGVGGMKRNGLYCYTKISGVSY